MAFFRHDDVLLTAREPEDDVAFDDGRAVSGLTRFRVLTLAVLGPLVTGYAAVAALLAVVTATATDAHFSTPGVLLAALPGWLAAHQVPVTILGLELGVLPLLPTIGLGAICARAAAGAAARLELWRPGQAGPVVAVISLAHGVAGAVIATVTEARDVTADPLAAFCYPALVASAAATLGVARRCGLLAAVADHADAVAVAGLRAGAFAVALLLAVGGAVLTFGLATSVQDTRAMFPAGWGNAIGMVLLSIGYLPNAIVAGTSFAAGPGFTIGDVTMSPLEFAGGPTPGLPLLAALPDNQEAWWPLLFALPLGVGVLVGRRLRNADDYAVSRLRGVAVASGVVALSFVVLAGSAGGRVGTGPLDPVTMRAAALSVALVLWIALPAAVTAWFGGPRPVPEAMPGLLDDDLDDHLDVDLDEGADEPEDVDAADAEPEEPAPARD